jgi:hypothetical protein
VLNLLILIGRGLALALRGHHEVVLENLALRQQLIAAKRAAKRPRLVASERLFWIVLAQFWRNWRSALVLVQPDTVVLTEYSVPVLAVAVAGQRLLPSSGRMTAVLIALLVSLRTTIGSRCELGRKSSRLGINSPYCNGAQRHDRAFVRLIGCCGCCSQGSGQTGGTRCRL